MTGNARSGAARRASPILLLAVAERTPLADMPEPRPRVKPPDSTHSGARGRSRRARASPWPAERSLATPRCQRHRRVGSRHTVRSSREGSWHRREAIAGARCSRLSPPAGALGRLRPHRRRRRGMDRGNDRLPERLRFEGEQERFAWLRETPDRPHPRKGTCVGKRPGSTRRRSRATPHLAVGQAREAPGASFSSRRGTDRLALTQQSV